MLRLKDVTRFEYSGGKLDRTSVRFDYPDTYRCKDAYPRPFDAHYDQLTGLSTVRLIDLPAEMEESMSGYSKSGGSYTLNPDEIRDLPHEMIQRFLFGRSSGVDINTMSLFIKDIGKWTPDSVIKLEGDDVLLVELKTCRGMSNIAFIKGMDQYSLLPSELIQPGVKIALSSIAVAPDSVCFSECFVFSDHNLRTMIDIVTTAQSIQNRLSAQGLEYRSTDKCFSICIPKVDLLDESDTLLISDSMVSHWINHEEKPVPIADDITTIMLLEKDRKQKTWDEPIQHGTDILMKNHPLVPDFDNTLETIPNASRIPNVISRELFEKAFTKYNWHDPKPIHVALGDDLPYYVCSQRTDFFRGLWGSMLTQEDSCNNFYRFSKDNRIKTFKPSILIHDILEERDEIKRRGDKVSQEPEDYEFTPNTYGVLYDKYPGMEASILPVVGSEPYVEEFCDEVWSLDAKVWQQIYQELNTSKMSGRGDWNRWYFHRTANFPCFILSHSTGQDNHTFFYLFIRLRIRPSGTNFKEVGSGWYTNIRVMSADGPKISQRLSVYEKLYMLRHYWLEIFEDETRSRIHFAMSWLIAWDAKQATIDLLSLFRYVYMEKTKYIKMDPLKVLTKVPVLRTPLQRFILCRMIQLSKMHNESRDDELNDAGLKSWVDFKPCNFHTCISLFYMHYATSHPSSRGMHSQTKIMEKLIKMEDLLPTDTSGIGYSSKSLISLNDHEFSLDYVLSIGRTVGKLLRSNHDYNSFFNYLSYKLSLLTVAEFSTFKKSTKLNQQERKFENPREYCFEAVKQQEWMSDLVSPFEDIPKLYELSKDDSAKRVSIFVKDQQTGLREIFVLNIVMRIAVKFIEVMARIINEAIPTETLCNSNRKTDLITEHKRLSVASMNTLVRDTRRDHPSLEFETTNIRLSNSADSATWCQQFCMPVFGAYLHSVLEEAFGNESQDLQRFCFHILNMITKKRIIVSDQLIEWFKFHEKDENLSDFMKRLSEYLSSYPEGIPNRSNMMQGVPHELSSSLHSAHLYYTSALTKKMVKSIAKNFTIDRDGIAVGDPVVTTLVSSDDSGTMLTIPILLTNNTASKRSYMELLARLHLFGVALEETKRYISARVSREKSTLYSLSPIFEFNSKFYYGNNVYCSDIKFLTAPLTLGYHDRLSGRVEEALSGLSGSLSNGVNQTLLYHLQFCLNRLHRRALVSDFIDLSPWQDVYSPCLGWVPLVRKGLIGLMNTEILKCYSIYKCSPYTRYLFIDDQLDDEEYALNVRFTLGGGSKYESVIKKWGLSKEEMIPRIASDPAGFFLGEMEQTDQIKLKLMNPGSRIALSRVSLSKIFSASAYAANSKCMSILKRKGGFSEKMTLLECRDFCLKEEWSYNPIDRSADIARLDKILDSCIEEKTRPCQRVENKMLLKSTETTLPKFGLIAMICDYWFGDNQSIRAKLLIDESSRYNPRIKHSFVETLEAHHDNYFLVLKSLRSLEQKDRVIKFIGPKCTSMDPLESYPSMLANLWSFKTKLVTSVTELRRQTREVMALEDKSKYYTFLEAASYVNQGWPFLRSREYSWMLDTLRADKTRQLAFSTIIFDREIATMALAISTVRELTGKLSITKVARNYVKKFRVSDTLWFERHYGQWYRFVSSKIGVICFKDSSYANPPTDYANVHSIKDSDLVNLCDLKVWWNYNKNTIHITSRYLPSLQNSLCKVDCVGLNYDKYLKHLEIYGDEDLIAMTNSVLKDRQEMESRYFWKFVGDKTKLKDTYSSMCARYLANMWRTTDTDQLDSMNSVIEVSNNAAVETMDIAFDLDQVAFDIAEELGFDPEELANCDSDSEGTVALMGEFDGFEAYDLGFDLHDLELEVQNEAGVIEDTTELRHSTFDIVRNAVRCSKLVVSLTLGFVDKEDLPNEYTGQPPDDWMTDLEMEHDGILRFDAGRAWPD
uniref:RNA-directed RNA polymerase L n=1 Tax=Phytomonas sp. TCC231 leishbunyavirus 1 TaxID=2060083 RepID=A0A2H4Z3S8_9VIRU|nr:RNA-dependent RNA polymerase [Phytomonas sp. TCC231 leishbunyavirus 1]